MFTGQEVLLATIVEFEVGPRVGLALHGGEILSRGWHCGTVFGPPASAATSSKLLNLNATQVENAFGIAFTQACGLMAAQFESSVKRMQRGFSSRNGLFATLMAEQNYKGVSRVFEREYGGYLNVFCM
jgi:aconitate decarboxylase